jgi:dipeptidyl aminopeptidase/acylaminoacyl peptidase
MLNPHRLVRWILPAVLLTVCGLSLAADPAPARTHDITVEDYFTQAYINNCVLSPDGRYVAYTEMRWEPPAEGRNTDLWVVDTQSGASRRLTFDPAKDESPRWSADSRWIYFLTKRGKEDDPAPLNGKTQIWKISVDGGDAQAITRLKDDVSDFALSKDGRSLYYLLSKEETTGEWKDLIEKYSKLTYGKGVVNFTQIWRLDLTTWRAEKLVDDNRVISDFAVAPDGQRIAMITTEGEEGIWGEGFSRVDIWDAAKKTVSTLDDSLWRKAAPSPYGWLEGLAWSSDSKKLAFRVDFDGYPAEMLVATLTGNGFVSQRLKRPGEFSCGETAHLEWIPGTSDLCFVADSKACARLAVISNVGSGTQGSMRILTPGDYVADLFHIDPAGRQFAVLIADTTHPPEIYLGSVSGTGPLKRLTHVNPQIDSWKLPHIQIVKWKGANGDECEGILELPFDYKPGQKLPLHVALHGGPSSADHLYFEYWIYGRGLWPALGWAVFAPNYRGSTGYGDKFLVDLVGRENDIEVQDILTGVDALIARGYVDSTKMAVSGWSNGGFLTNCLITKTDRFKAAASGAGVMDMSMQWGTEDTPGHVVNFMQGFPWNKADAYRKASPLYDLDKVKTPTLIHVGAEDGRVPAVHARTLYRALSFYRHIPCELLEYPGQGHGLVKYSYRKAKLEWEIAWFDRYVLGKSVSEPEKPGN